MLDQLKDLLKYRAHTAADRGALRRAIARLERLESGMLLPEELQNLCHNLHMVPGTTLQAFRAGCEDMQKRLYGRGEA